MVAKKRTKETRGRKPIGDAARTKRLAAVRISEEEDAQLAAVAVANGRSKEGQIRWMLFGGGAK